MCPRRGLILAGTVVLLGLGIQLIRACGGGGILYQGFCLLGWAGCWLWGQDHNHIFVGVHVGTSMTSYHGPLQSPLLQQSSTSYDARCTDSNQPINHFANSLAIVRVLARHHSRLQSERVNRGMHTLHSTSLRPHVVESTTLMQSRRGITFFTHLFIAEYGSSGFYKY